MFKLYRPRGTDETDTDGGKRNLDWSGNVITIYRTVGKVPLEGTEWEWCSTLYFRSGGRPRSDEKTGVKEVRRVNTRKTRCSQFSDKRFNRLRQRRETDTKTTSGKGDRVKRDGLRCMGSSGRLEGGEESSERYGRVGKIEKDPENRTNNYEKKPVNSERTPLRRL